MFRPEKVFCPLCNDHCRASCVFMKERKDPEIDEYYPDGCLLYSVALTLEELDDAITLDKQ